jgi:hypothetical protein
MEEEISKIEAFIRTSRDKLMKDLFAASRNAAMIRQDGIRYV